MRKFLLLSTFLLGTAFTVCAQNNTQGNQALFIESRPKPSYTEEARKNSVEGWVKLMVTFKADGTIGDVVYHSESSMKKKKLTKYGLVKQAIDAAKAIDFIPATKNDQPVTVTKMVEYRFTLY